MGISKDLKDKAQKTREDDVFTLKLDEGVSLAMLVSFARDMFPGVSAEDIGVWPADDGAGVGTRWRTSCIELNSPELHDLFRAPCLSR
jgi:hypothetical protein